MRPWPARARRRTAAARLGDIGRGGVGSLQSLPVVGAPRRFSPPLSYHASLARAPQNRKPGSTRPMIGDPTRLVVRAGFPRLSAAEMAPFRERSTSFVVD